nr:BatA domain-containing protein [Saprospiraceae bacterium]
MQFINPQFLWGLLFLAIPIIIHLFQFRRFKKVYFSNTPFLKEIKETSQQSRKLKHLLVLFSRLIAVAFLVLAFAQPVIPTGDKVVTGTRAVSIFIDNSFSMSSMGRDISLLNNARLAARNIINGYGEADEFQILTGDFENRHQRLYNREQALDMINEIQVSPAVRTLPDVIQRQEHALRNYSRERQSFYLISDFQKNITSFPENSDSLLSLNLVYIESIESSNVSIDSVWFSQPLQIVNQNGEMLVQITNHSTEQSEEVNLELKLADQRRPAGRISLVPGQTLVDTVTFTINRAGWQKATVSITDYPIQFDDEYHLSFHVKDNINVLTIHSGLESNRFLSALFRGIPYMTEDLMRASNINYSALSDYNLIILNELEEVTTGFASELKDYLSSGGNLLIFPAPVSGGGVLNTLTDELGLGTFSQWSEGEFQVGQINMEDPLFTGVFEEVRQDLKLPKSTGRYVIPSRGGADGVPLLSYRDTRSFVSKYPCENGSVFICSSPLNTTWNDLVSNGEVFVPLLYRAAIATGTEDRVAYAVGTDRLIPIRNVSSERQPDFRITGQGREFIPGVEQRTGSVQLNVYDQISEPGFYEVYQGEEQHKTVAFNYDRRESEIATYAREDLEEMTGGQAVVTSHDGSTTASALFGSSRSGKEFWMWCIITVLAALLIEQILLRFWKVGNRKS